MNFHHLSKCVGSLHHVALCNLHIYSESTDTSSPGQNFPQFPALRLLCLQMCSWGEKFEAQLRNLAPNLENLRIVAPHAFIPSDTLTSNFEGSNMPQLESIIIQHPPPFNVTKCARRYYNLQLKQNNDF